MPSIWLTGTPKSPSIAPIGFDYTFKSSSKYPVENTDHELVLLSMVKFEMRLSNVSLANSKIIKCLPKFISREQNFGEMYNDSKYVLQFKMSK